MFVVSTSLVLLLEVGRTTARVGAGYYNLATHETVWSDSCVASCLPTVEMQNSVKCVRNCQSSLEDNDNGFFEYLFRLPSSWKLPVDVHFTALFWAIGDWHWDESTGTGDKAVVQHCDDADKCVRHLEKSKLHANCDEWTQWKQPKDRQSSSSAYQWLPTEWRLENRACYWNVTVAVSNWTADKLKIGFGVFNSQSKDWRLDNSKLSQKAWILSDFKIEFTPMTISSSTKSRTALVFYKHKLSGDTRVNDLNQDMLAIDSRRLISWARRRRSGAQQPRVPPLPAAVTSGTPVTTTTESDESGGGKNNGEEFWKRVFLSVLGIGCFMCVLVEHCILSTRRKYRLFAENFVQVVSVHAETNRMQRLHDEAYVKPVRVRPTVASIVEKRRKKNTSEKKATERKAAVVSSAATGSGRMEDAHTVDIRLTDASELELEEVYVDATVGGHMFVGGSEEDLYSKPDQMYCVAATAGTTGW